MGIIRINMQQLLSLMTNIFSYLQKNKLSSACLATIVVTLALTTMSTMSLVNSFRFTKNHNSTSPMTVTRKDEPQKASSPTMFGKYIPLSNADKSIPTTMLNLKLIGVLKATPSNKSQAIIQMGQHQEKVFRLNDTLPGDAKIIRIFDKSILLIRQGHVERLSLPDKRLEQTRSLPKLEFQT